MKTSLADILLVLHFAYILAIVLPLPLIAVGVSLNWKWVRNARWRHWHLAAVAYLIIQTLTGTTCPLTDWESEIRFASGQGAYETTFIEHWLGRWMYFDLASGLFTIVYLCFGLSVIFLYFYFPPANFYIFQTKKNPAGRSSGGVILQNDDTEPISPSTETAAWAKPAR